jgi:hypothetical protein
LVLPFNFEQEISVHISTGHLDLLGIIHESRFIAVIVSFETKKSRAIHDPA